MTLLVGKEKVKFDLHQSMPLTDEEKGISMKIENLLSPIEDNAPMLFEEDTLERFEIMVN